MTGNTLKDAKVMFRHACSFADCARFCESDKNDLIVRTQWYTIPGIVNSAFASLTISISSARAVCCASSSTQSQRVAYTNRMSSKICSRSAISLPNARRNSSFMSFSYKCGVVQRWSHPHRRRRSLPGCPWAY